MEDGAAVNDTKPSVGLVCEDEALAEILMRALVGRAEVRRVPPAIEKLEGLDALLLVFGPKLSASVELLAMCLAERPHLPVMGISELETNWVVELLECGMADHLTPPIDTGLLQRKLDRMVLKGSGTVLDVPAFAHLPHARDRATQSNERTCVRARISPEFPAALSLAAAGKTAPAPPQLLSLVDVSILTDERPGGLCVRVEPWTEAGAQLLRLTPGASSAVVLHLPKSLAREPVPARVKLVRIIKPSAMTQGATWHAFQYWLDRLRDEAILQQLWIRSQMLERAARTRMAG